MANLQAQIKAQQDQIAINQKAEEERQTAVAEKQRLSQQLQQQQQQKLEDDRQAAAIEEATAYSIYAVAKESRGCLKYDSFYNGNLNASDCITIPKGEKVAVWGMAILSGAHPSQGDYYCLRPIRMNDSLEMSQCYYTDPTAIKINGIVVPSTGRLDPPSNEDIAAKSRLRNLYQSWMYVYACNQVRQGYMVQYVNDDELERAHKGLQGAEQNLVKKYPILAGHTQQIWDETVNSKEPMPPINLELCHQHAARLWNASPAGAIYIPRP